MTETIEDVDGPARANVPPSRLRRILRKTIHTLSYHLILKRGASRIVRAAGFRLRVPPTVFHPRLFLASEYLADCIDRLDLRGKRVADMGTGTGILALAAARAGAAQVLAVDINPTAARAASENARLNGLDDRLWTVCSDLFSALAPRPLFDVIISNPPYFPGEPRDLADRAWHAGPGYRDIIAMFDQARERLAPGGKFYVLLSSDSDLEFLHSLIVRAQFRARILEEHSIFVERLVIYELSTQ